MWYHKEIFVGKLFDGNKAADSYGHGSVYSFIQIGVFSKQNNELHKYTTLRCAFLNDDKVCSREDRICNEEIWSQLRVFSVPELITAYRIN